MEQKRSITGIAIGIAFIFFGLLHIYSGTVVSKTYQPWQLSSNIIAVILACIGIFVFMKWDLLKFWQKGAIVGIATRMMIVGLLSIVAGRGRYLWQYKVIDFFRIISCPFDVLSSKLSAHIYMKAIETIEPGKMVVYYSKYWEIVLYTILNLLYAAIIGAIVAMFIKKYIDRPKQFS